MTQELMSQDVAHGMLKFTPGFWHNIARAWLVGGFAVYLVASNWELRQVPIRNPLRTGSGMKFGRVRFVQLVTSEMQWLGHSLPFSYPGIVGP
jgi:hypothetical protein